MKGRGGDWNHGRYYVRVRGSGKARRMLQHALKQKCSGWVTVDERKSSILILCVVAAVVVVGLAAWLG